MRGLIQHFLGTCRVACGILGDPPVNMNNRMALLPSIMMCHDRTNNVHTLIRVNFFASGNLKPTDFLECEMKSTKLPSMLKNYRRLLFPHVCSRLNKVMGCDVRT